MQGCSGCVSEKKELQTWAQLNITKKVQSFSSPSTHTDTFNIIILQTTNVCNMDFFLFHLCKNLHIQIIFTLQHLFFFFIDSSFCQNPHLYLTLGSLYSSLAYITAIALSVLAVFTTCPPLPPTPRAFLSKQLNWPQNANV